MLKAIGVPLLAGKGAELAGEDAVVRVVDVAIDDVAGALADLSLPDEIRDGTDGVEILGFEQALGVGVGDSFARHHFVVDVAQVAVL